MLQHPDFLDVRRLAIVLAVSPFALLLMLVAIDFSFSKTTANSVADSLCTQAGAVVNVSNRQCSN